MTDITDRKRAEEEHVKLRQLEADLARVNRISMMGELAASLAHEIKQPITGAALNAGVLVRWLQNDPPRIEDGRRKASDLITTIKRVNDIVDRNQSLYRQGSSQRELIDLNDTIRHMVALLRDTANRNSISIQTELDPQLAKATADRVQLQQVLMNLMLNGIEAMKGASGALTITSKRSEDGHLMVSVGDSGVGLPADGADRIFPGLLHQRQTAPASDCRSVAGSSSRTTAGYGRPRTRHAAPCFISRCRSRRAPRPDRKKRPTLRDRPARP